MAGSDISRVALNQPTGPVELPFRDGYFVGDLGPVWSAGKLPAGESPVVIAGYDSRGNEVANVNINELVATHLADKHS